MELMKPFWTLGQKKFQICFNPWKYSFKISINTPFKIEGNFNPIWGEWKNTIRKVGRNLFNWYCNQPHQKVNMRFLLKRCSTETLKPRQRFWDKRIEVFCLILIHSILEYSISNHFLDEWNASCGTFCLSLNEIKSL